MTNRTAATRLNACVAKLSTLRTATGSVAEAYHCEAAQTGTRLQRLIDLATTEHDTPAMYVLCDMLEHATAQAIWFAA